MKLNTSVLVISLCILNSCSQQSHNIAVPEVVDAQFESMHLTITEPEWELEDGMYEASFMQNHQEISVVIASDGNVHHTETELEVKLLPKSVKDYVASQLENKKIREASKIVNADGTISYEAEVGRADYLFDGKGQLISQEKNERKEKRDNK